MRRTSPKLVGTRTNEPDCLSDEANLAETQPRSAVPIPASTNRANQHCFASLALHTACACGAVGPFASLVTRRRRSLLRFSCVAYRACLWRRRSLRFARHRTASLIASLLLRCKRRVPVAPSVPSLRSSQDGVAHCFASLALQRVCLWRRRSLRFARHKTASLIASLLVRCKRRVPVAPSVPSLRSSHDGVAHCFASLALQTACACGAVGPFASLVTRQRRSLLRFSGATRELAPPHAHIHAATTAQTCPIGARRESSLHPMRTHIRAHAPRNKSLCGARNTF